MLLLQKKDVYNAMFVYERWEEGDYKMVFNWLIWYHVVGGMYFYWLKMLKYRIREREGVWREEMFVENGDLLIGWFQFVLR